MTHGVTFLPVTPFAGVVVCDCGWWDSALEDAGEGFSTHVEIQAAAKYARHINNSGDR